MDTRLYYMTGFKFKLNLSVVVKEISECLNSSDIGTRRNDKPE